MTQDQAPTTKEIVGLLEALLATHVEMNENAIGLIFAIAIRLGISHDDLLSEGEQIVEQIKHVEKLEIQEVIRRGTARVGGEPPIQPAFI